MGYFTVLIIAFIVLVIIRANSTKINSFTALLCIAIFGSTVYIVIDWRLHEVFFVIAPVVLIVLAFWIGKKLGNDEPKNERDKEGDKEGVMSKRTNEELIKIVDDFKTSSIYNRGIQEFSSSNDDDIKLTPEDFIELVKFSSALEELKKRGLIEGEIPSITLNLTPADEHDDSEHVFNKTQ